MKNTRTTLVPSLLASLAACTTAGPASIAMPEPSGDLLADAAALLVAAEQADSDEARMPLVERLDAMQVAVFEDSDDDPLAEWRSALPKGSTQVYRGRTLGPAYRRAQLPPGESMRIEQIFYAGERAELVAQTNGGEVALKVANPRAEAVCDKQLAPRADCRWLPIFTERFSIELENRSSDQASVYLVFR